MTQQQAGRNCGRFWFVIVLFVAAWHENLGYCGAATTTTRATTGLRLPTFLADHMVMPRKGPVVWGWANEGVEIQVTLYQENDVVLATTQTVAYEGTWKANLIPLAPHVNCTLKIQAFVYDNNNNSSEYYYSDVVLLQDVAIGDVFLCSGQSNMEMTVAAAMNDTNIATWPAHVRLFTVALNTSDIPLDNVVSKSPHYTWARSNMPGAVITNDTTDESTVYWGVYSATCFYTGLYLYQYLNNNDDSNTIIPIGLVTAAWGGQRIQTFMSTAALLDETCGGTQHPTNRIKDELGLHNDNGASELHAKLRQQQQQANMAISTNHLTDQVQDSQIWNAMIHPLRHMPFAGVVWYQGEANSDEQEQINNYVCQFPAMIADWQQHYFGNDDSQRQHEPNHHQLPFVYVQLAGFAPRELWPQMRQAQDFVLPPTLPGTGRAVAIDLADPDATLGPIHPRRKREVGRRVALNMMQLLYEDYSRLAEGPCLATVEKDGDWDEKGQWQSAVKVQFVPESAQGLHLADTASCTACCEKELPFHVLHTDGTWTRVSQAIVVDTFVKIVLHDTQDDIVGVRYAWDAQPECALYNGRGGPDDHTGLVASPFEWCAYPSGEGAWTGTACLTEATSLSHK